ncbi:PorP/SprF family type IX secretion system membrane protein [Flavobacterium sp. RSSB_23]|uniref:PorP/SprF family type IX secretion system membrane protein n=1 Tax=Flavobacterium sp. RSSB_23 TaxID=3447668 RepID=UPI003F338703
MKKILLFIAFFYGMHHELYAQAVPAEDGVVSFSLPIRTSLKYNRFVVNPTFSFVREQNTIASIFSKRQWVQFDNAPTTYFASYSGRFLENEGVGLGVFKQNYGVLTTFGALANFAHNVVLEQDSNLTFGLNLSAYKSGLDAGKVIANGVSDPSLNTIPSNFLLTVSPGINYGTTFFDFGLALNNIVSYNFSTSNMLQDDPEKAVQAHIMYTGYLDTYGFFDKSKFSTLVRSEFKKDKTVLSGLAMFSIPMGVWAQAGYNTLYGISAGIGMNITSSISIEYNFEKAMGGFDAFGSSHDIVLAYKFKNKTYYYGDDEEEGALIKPSEAPSKPSTTQPKQSTLLSPVDKANLEAARKEAQAAREQMRLAKLKEIADAKAKAEADAKAKLTADAKAKADAEAAQKAALEKERLNKERLAAEAKAKADAEAKAKAAAPTAAQKAAAEKARLAKLAADAKVKADAEALEKAAEVERQRQAKLAADAKAKADAEAAQKAAAEKARLAKLAADAKVKADAEAQQKAAADAKAKADAEAERLRQAKLAADAKAKADAEAQQKAAADAKAKADAEAERLRQEKLAADAKAKADAEAAQKAAADAKAKADAEAERLRQEKLAADAKAKADAEAAQKAAADAKAKADAEAERLRQEKLAADAKAKADAEAAQKAAAEAKAKADAEAERLRQEKLAADAKAKADAEAAQKAVADAKAKADAEAERLRQAKLAADAKAKADAEAAQKAAAEAKAKADAETERLRLAKLAADAKAIADAEAEKIRLAKVAAAAPVVKDESAKAIDNLAKQAEESSKMQQSLIAQLDQKVANKAKELRDMKEENDLSEQGIVREPQEIKSTSNDNAAIESLKSQIAALNKMQEDNIAKIKNLFDDRIKKGASPTDALSVSYLKSIDQLKVEQAASVQSNSKLVQTLENIKVAVEIEKKRRIKRANSLNDTDRLAQDQATLKRIKETTKVSATPLKESDFDFGEEQSNMQIMKRVSNTPSGYYMIMAVHKDIAKRDAFLTKAVASGMKNVAFYYDANTSSYYIYSTMFDNLQEAQQEIKTKASNPSTSKMVIIKVEN